MSQPYYRPPFVKQLTGTPCAHANCNMASAATLLRRVTLGLTVRTPDQLRTLSGTAGECTDADKLNDGTSLENAATALAKVGLLLHVERHGTIVALDNLLDAGHPVMLAGDYDQVPDNLSGQKDFDGLHGVMANERANGAVFVYDPLDDARRTGIPQGPLWWPETVMRNYLIKLPGDIQYAYTGLRRLTASVSRANIRSGPSRTFAVLGQLQPPNTLQWGGVVTGESIGGDRRWYRVWYPAKARLAYMHASVIVRR